ncbi:TROVE domain-containing protein [Microtetraspora fusca]|uniref:TROVE domain-containing protein n=1 Tax=Microtetraspora fusca TaxID=1997 RepID=A0ABW6VE30_MICFU
MSKFNNDALQVVAPTGPITSEQTATATTHQGAPGFRRDPHSELFLLAVTNFVSEDTAYETGTQRNHRFRDLVRQLAISDPDWLARMIRWLRAEAGMRSAAVVAAAEVVHARIGGELHGHSRAVVADALQRADEPGEILAYWFATYGRNLPIPLKRGIADAVFRLYNERALLKYDNPTKPIRFGDVIELVQPRYHAKAYGTWRDSLFRYAIERRHGRGNPIPEGLPVLRAHADLYSIPVEQRRTFLDREHAAEMLARAGVTWESLAAWLQGPMDARAWATIIPSMGVFALVRNLRNFDKAGLSDEDAATVITRLTDAAAVRRSRVLPLRFLAAYRAAPSLRWAWPLQQAMDHSLDNLPLLAGRTLILVDQSGSMDNRLGRQSELTRADAAAAFGSALAVRAQHADLYQFGYEHDRVEFHRADSTLRILGQFRGMGGTETAAAVRATYDGHDRVVILTDEQANGGWGGANPTMLVPDNIPVYTWNLAGYEHGHGADGPNRYTFGGLSDKGFEMIPLLERGVQGDWPF